MQLATETTVTSKPPDDSTGDTDFSPSNGSSNPDVLFWVGGGVGTGLAGGVFGFFLEGFAGLFVGTIIAVIYSIPTQFSAAIVSWALWLERFRIGLAMLAGAATGVWAMVLALSTSMYGSIGPLAAATGVLGALGAGIVTSWMTFRTTVGRELHAAAKARKWQFSLGNLFVHFTVLCVLLVFWIVTIGKFLDARTASRTQEEQTMQRLPSDAD